VGGLVDVAVDDRHRLDIGAGHAYEDTAPAQKPAVRPASPSPTGAVQLYM
jgi:hypothetical protein